MMDSARGDLDSMQKHLKYRHERHLKRCVINPEESKPLRKWELCTGISLVFVCFVTPYEVAFIHDEITDEYLSSGADALFWINRIVDLVFVIDMSLQFIIMYPVPNQYGTTLIASRRLIARKYLRTWFIIDLMSILPFDIFAAYMESNDLAKLRLLRGFKLLRLLKLARLFRGLRLVQKWAVEVSIPYRQMTVIKIAASVIITAHWVSCIVGILSDFQGKVCTNPEESLEPDCQITWLSDMARDMTSQNRLLTHSDMYVIGLYVAATVIVHPHHSPPRNTEERVCFIVLIFWGGFIWTRVISKLTAIATSLSRHTIYHHQTIDDLNAITSKLRLKPELRKRLRAFFLSTPNASQQNMWKDLKTRMSPALLLEVQYEINKGWMRRVPYLAAANRFIIRDLTGRVKTFHVARGETFGANFTLYVLQQGLCTWTKDREGHMAMLTPGSVWGEEHLLLNEWQLLVPNTASSLAFSEVMSLHRTDLDEVCKEYPDYRQILRRHYLWHAVVRTIILMRRMQKDGTLKMDLHNLDANGCTSVVTQRMADFLEKDKEANLTKELEDDDNGESEHCAWRRKSQRQLRDSLRKHTAGSLLEPCHLKPLEDEQDEQNGHEERGKSKESNTPSQDNVEIRKSNGESSSHNGFNSTVSGCSNEALQQMEERITATMMSHMSCLHWRTCTLESSVNNKLEELSKSIDAIKESLHIPAEKSGDQPTAPAVRSVSPSRIPAVPINPMARSEQTNQESYKNGASSSMNSMPHLTRSELLVQVQACNNNISQQTKALLKQTNEFVSPLSVPAAEPLSVPPTRLAGSSQLQM